MAAGIVNLQFNIVFHAPIWNIVLDSGHSFLVAEIRETATRQVSFAAIDLDNPHAPLLWQDFRPDPSWWWSTVGIYNGVLLLHRYTDARQPEPKGLLAVDVRSRQVLWQHPEWVFQQVSGNALTVSRLEAEMPVFRNLDLTTGQDLSGKEQPIMPSAEPPFHQDILYPLHYPEENTYFQPIARFLSQQLQIQPVKAFDYAEFQGLVVVSYYLCAQSGLINRLVVLDEQARVLLHETLESDLPGVGQATFLIRHGSLIFVREKKELMSYGLD